jgi:hypothetical protein
VTRFTSFAILAAACTSTTTKLVPTPDTTPPLVVWTTPQPGQRDVAQTTEVSAIFSEAMDGATVDASTFLLADPSGPVAAAVTMADDRTAVLSATLSAGTLYTATITTGAQDLAGNGLTAPVAWTFTAAAAPDTTPPTIVGIAPPAGSIGNQVSTTIVSVTLSEAIDCTRITDSSLRVYEAGVSVPGYVACDAALVTFHPLFELPTQTTLEAFLDPTVSDLAGNQLGRVTSWTFTMAPWTQQHGTPVNDGAQAIVTDSAGNIFVAGWTDGSLDGNTNTSGGSNLVLIEYDAIGARQWTRQLGPTAGGVDAAAYAVALDATGNIFVAGNVFGALDGNAWAGDFDLFVTKYDGTGAKQWTRQLGTSAADTAFGVATDAAGNVYVVGYTGGDLDGNINAGGLDLFVVKYDGSGTKQWTRQLGSAVDDLALGAAADATGDLYLTGYTGGNLDGNLNAGGDDVFVVKYDATGAKQWTQLLGSPGFDQGRGIAIDATGSIYVGGSTTDSLDGNPGAGGYDLFVAKYDGTGVRQWTRQLGSPGDDFAPAVATDANGNVYAAGSTSGGLDGNTNAGADDVFVVSYDSTGAKRWTRQLGTAFDDDASCVTVDLNGNVFVGGGTRGGLDGHSNAGGTSSSAGDDLFVLKYQTDGRKR